MKKLDRKNGKRKEVTSTFMNLMTKCLESNRLITVSDLSEKFAKVWTSQTILTTY